MIPKIIHYCWFGRGPMPELALKCIESWHEFMPDWEYKLWNEDSFDINFNDYTREAYQAKKYAFVSDVARLYALFTEGGVYMDTDVEVLKPYDDLLSLSGFTGYEGCKAKLPVTGTMASEAGNEWVKEQLDSYQGAHFVKEDGSFDLTTNTWRITRIMQKNGFVQDGKRSMCKDMHIFPVEYFCPRQTTGEVFITENTYCDHHFMGTWNESKGRSLLRKLIGQKNITRLIKIKRKLIG